MGNGHPHDVLAADDLHDDDHFHGELDFPVDSDALIANPHILRNNRMCKLNKKKGSYFLATPAPRYLTGSHLE